MISHCRSIGLRIFSIPGPCSLVSSFSVSGFELSKNEPLSFWGYFPRKIGEQTNLLMKMRNMGGFVVFFEVASRLLKTLTAIQAAFGPETKVFISKEITKVYEAHWFDSVDNHLTKFKDGNSSPVDATRGEFVVTLDVPKAVETDLEDERLRKWIYALQPHMTNADLVKILSRELQVSKKKVYSYVIRN